MKKILTIIGLAALVGCQAPQPAGPKICNYCNTRIPGHHTGGFRELQTRMLLGDYSGTGITPERAPAINAWIARVEDNRAAMARTLAITSAIESANRNRYNYSYPSNYPGSYFNPIYVEAR
jgi:hypothetical protein